MTYAVVIEKGEESYSGYPLDIEGIYAFGDTEAEVTEKLTKAIEDRISQLRAEGQALPQPSHSTASVYINIQP